MEEKIDINQADITTLEQIQGIGPALAAKIVEYRTAVHPFEEVIELAAVPGISERMVRQFEEQVTVGDKPNSDEPVADTAESSLSDAQPIVTVDVTEEDTPSDVETAVSPSEPSTQDTSAQTEDPPRPAFTSLPSPHPIEEAEPPLMAAPIAEPMIADTKEQEQEMPTESPSELPPTPTNDEAVSRRRGCLFIIIGAVAGAILGTALTLAVLFTLNNSSLEYANQRVERDLQQAETALERLTGTLEAVEANLDSVSSQANTFAEEQTTLSTALEAVSSEVSDVEADVANAEGDIERLSETAVMLEERLDTVAVSAETFDAFLEGMRSLLGELSGEETAVMAPTATIDLTITPTPAAEDEMTPTPSPIPTRTPRPTSTPIVLPSPTPGQQP